MRKEQPKLRPVLNAKGYVLGWEHIPEEAQPETEKPAIPEETQPSKHGKAKKGNKNAAAGTD